MLPVNPHQVRKVLISFLRIINYELYFISDVAYSSYNSYNGYPGAASFVPGTTYNKDWAANRAYNAYGFLDADKHKPQ